MAKYRRKLLNGVPINEAIKSLDIMRNEVVKTIKDFCGNFNLNNLLIVTINESLIRETSRLQRLNGGGISNTTGIFKEEAGQFEKVDYGSEMVAQGRS